MSTVESRFRVTGMDCASCAAKVDAAVRRVPGVHDVTVSATAGSMNVRHEPEAVLLPGLAEALDKLGYGVAEASTAKPHHAHAHDPEEATFWGRRKGALIIGAGLALVVAFAIGQIAPAVEWWAFLAALAIGLVPIARRAWAAGRAGIPFSIETLMTVAAVGAVIIGAAEEAAAVIFLFLVGEWLEGYAAGRARSSIRSLAALTPKTAFVERNGQVEEIAAGSVSVGDFIRVRPGDRVAADGEIIEGEGSIDEAPMTGESTPVRKGPGAQVLAGTINIDTVLRVRVTAAAEDNTIARVVKLVEEAQESKARTERFIDRFSRYYTPAIFGLAVLVASGPPLMVGEPWLEWIYKGLAVLLIGCPCALVISTPAAIAAALSAGARRGLLIKGGAVLESLRHVSAVAFDKTGTLTCGTPEVTDVVAFCRPEKQVLSLAAALESGSSHPLALAIVERARSAGAPIPPAAETKAIAGKGVEGLVGGELLFLGSENAALERASLSADLRARTNAFNDRGKSVAVLLSGETPIALFAMRDEPRPDARRGIQNLVQAGIRTIMLTGDNRRTAEALAVDLGMAEHRSELLPQDKLTIVRDLQASGLVVAKVGDGINDAPALAAADIGIAMGGGTDVALETADAAVLHGRVLDIGGMVNLSKAAMRNIRQNIAIALGLKAAFLVTTVLGITGLWPAILADTGATVLVTANALRLLDWRGE